jgi:hypothetical protein
VTTESETNVLLDVGLGRLAQAANLHRAKGSAITAAPRPGAVIQRVSGQGIFRFAWEDHQPNELERERPLITSGRSSPGAVIPP